MRNKFVYFCSIKICASGFNKLLESIFCLLLVVEMFSLQKIVEMLEEVVVGWWEVRWIWQRKQTFEARFIKLLKPWLCAVWSGTVGESNRALSIDECWLRALQLPAHLVDLLSVLLRCNCFTGIQKAVVDQITKQWPWPFFGASLVLANALELLLSQINELVMLGCCIKSIFHHTS